MDDNVADQNTVPPISYFDLIQQITPQYGLTVADQKRILLDYVCSEVGLVQDTLPHPVVTDLKCTISKFFYLFTQKYNQSNVSRKLERLPQQWCQNILKIPNSLLSFLSASNGLPVEGVEDQRDESQTSNFDEPTELFKLLNSERMNIITRQQLCQEMRNNKLKHQIPFTDISKQQELLLTFILDNLGLSFRFLSPSGLRDLRKEISSFLYEVKRHFVKSNFIFSKMMSLADKDFNSYLGATKLFCIPESVFSTRDEQQQIRNKPPTPIKRQMAFAVRSKRGQQMACAELRNSKDPDLIVATATQVVKSPAMGQLIRKANTFRGVTAKRALDALKEAEDMPTGPTKHTPQEALAYMLTHNQTRQDYCDMKKACSAKGANIWPDYNQVLKAKTDCRPKGIEVEETEAKVAMQDLLNHTASRIFNEDQDLKFTLEGLSARNNGELQITFYFKFGMDGCGSFNSFMQKDSTGKVRDLKSLMTSQMVPLQATAMVGEEIKIVYSNSSPNSANSCRPIRLCFEREDKDSISREASRLQGEVSQLVPFIISDVPRIEVKFKGLFTMVDGKVLNELTSNPSSANCPICHKSSKQMSSQAINFPPVEGSLAFGVSPLHFGIRSFELLYNIGYRRDTKKFGGRWTDEEREKKKACKKKVKADFLDKLGLIIDQRRDGGAGNTTTGNVARRAFENAEITADICGVSAQLVKNISVIWGTLSSGFAIDAFKFDLLCQETLRLYFDTDQVNIQLLHFFQFKKKVVQPALN